MQNALQSLTKQAEERTSELKDKVFELTQSNIDKENRIRKCEQSFQEVWDYVKRPNLRIIGVPEEEENSESLENIFGVIIEETFPGLVRDLDTKYKKLKEHLGNSLQKDLHLGTLS